MHVAQNRDSRPPIPPLLVFGAALVQLAANFASPALSVCVGSVLVAFIIWCARAEYLPALLVTQLVKTDFLLEGYGTEGFVLNQLESGAVLIGGFPVTVSYALGALLVARVWYECLTQPRTFRDVGMFWLVPVWSALMIPATFATFLGRQEMNPSWTGTIRMIFMTGALFYGLIIGRNSPNGARYLLNWLVPMSGFFFCAAAVGYFHHRVLWILTALAVPMAWAMFRRKGLLGTVFAAGVFLAGLVYALGLGPGMDRENTDYAAGVMGSGSSTFTLNALFGVGLLLTAVLARARGGLRRIYAKLLGWPAFAFVVFASFAIAWLSPRMESYQGRSSFQSNSVGLNIAERLRAKIFDDRSIIWSATLDDITAPPYLVVPAGRPLIISHPRWGLAFWPNGAHNTVFEILRVQRWVVGPILLYLVGLAMTRCAQTLAYPRSPELVAIALGTLSTATVGVFTGHYPVGDQGAFWFLGFAGFVVGAWRTTEPEPHGPRKHSYRD